MMMKMMTLKILFHGKEPVTCQEHRVSASLKDTHDESKAEKNLAILEKTETSISNQNQTHSSNSNVQSPLKVLKYAKLSEEYHSNSENPHPESIFHHFIMPLGWSLTLTRLTLTPILLRLAPMMGLTMNTVISKAPNTRPKCHTSSPLLTASRGKKGA